MADKDKKAGGPGQPPINNKPEEKTEAPKPAQENKKGNEPKLTEVDIYTTSAAREIRGLGISVPCTNRKMTDEDIKIAIRQGFNVQLSNNPIGEKAYIDKDDNIIYG